jgi:hypothetical protein
MTETGKELAAEHTRRELEEMAEKLGIGTIGIGTKVSLAEAIIKAEEKASAKEMPKPNMEVKAPKVEVKARVKPAIGKKGVFAKRAAIEEAVAVIGTGINAQIKENEEAVAVIGTGINAQIKENEEAVKALNKSIEEKTDVLQKGVDEIHSGIMEIQNETANYIKDFYYG